MTNAYTDIALATGARFAGIYILKMVPREWLATDPVVDFTTGKILSTITLLSGKNWLQLNTVPDSTEYTEAQKNADAGDYFELQVKGILTAYGPEAQLALETYRYHEWVVEFIDKAKTMRIAGNKQHGLHFGADFACTGKNGGVATYTVTMGMESPCRAPFCAP